MGAPERIRKGRGRENNNQKKRPNLKSIIEKIVRAGPGKDQKPSREKHNGKIGICTV